MTEPQSVLALQPRPSKTPGVPPGGRRKRWPLVAAGLLLLIGGIAFGVYQLTYKTPHGTLVVEIDDKDVEARFQNGELRLLDGDGKLKYVLKPSEKNKTLPPGEYRIEVTGADGLKLDTDRFEMHKGDKVTVRVLLKAEAVAKAPAPVAVSPEPFVILARRAQPPKAFATLKAAVAGAKSGDTIEIYGDGPFDCTPIDIGAKDLVIRAGAGFRPRLQYDRPDAPPTTGIENNLIAGGRLVLEGLEFQRCSASESPATNSVHGRPSSSLHVAHCRFLSRNPGDGIAYTGPTLQVRRCEFLETAYHGSIHWNNPPGGGKASVEGCVFNNAKVTPNSRFMAVTANAFPKYSLDIRNNTFAGSNPLDILFPTASREEIAAARKTGRVRFTNNALVGCYALVRYPRWRAFKDSMSAQQAVDAMPSILDWSDQGNAYPTNQQFLSAQDDVEPLSAPEIKSLKDWHKWWGIADSSSVQGDLRFATALADAPDLERITPAQFRLADGSVGKGTGPGGRDVGADVDAVGPGAPYEAWKKTADYQQWLKDTGQVEISDPQRETAEWVMARGGRLSLDGGDDVVSKPDQIPPGPVQIRGVRFDQKSNVTDDDLERFRPCTELERLWFSTSCDVTDAGLAKLASFPNVDRLTNLVLNGAKLTPACLGTLPRFKSLKRLDLDNAPLGDIGLTVIAKLKNLQALSVQFCGVTDEGLADFRGRKLALLQVSGNPKVTDAGLKALGEVSWYLNVAGTGVTDAGFDTIAGWTKLQVLYLMNIPVTDAGLAKLKDLTELIELDINGTKVTDAGLIHLRGMRKLTKLHLPTTAITDKGLDQLAKLASLRFLKLQNTGVTAAGVKKLATALPQCKIEWDGGVIEPKTDPQRETAEWVLARGGRLWIRGVPGLVSRPDQIPPSRVRITGVDFEEPLKYRVTDEDLERFRPCDELVALNLWVECDLTDAGLAKLAAFPRVERFTQLVLYHAKLTPVWVISLARFKSLNMLALRGVPLGELGLTTIARLKDLTYLDADECGVTDEGLAELRGLTKLEHLQVGENPKVTDVGLKALRELPLRHLVLNATGVTDAGLDAIAACTKLEALYLEAIPVSDAGLAKLKDMAALTALAIGGTKVTDAGLAHLGGMRKLRELHLRESAVTDKGLDQLANLSSLRSVDLRNTRVTATGVKKLATALPRCRIEWDGGVIEPKAVPDPQRETAEWVLARGGELTLNGVQGLVTRPDQIPPGPVRIYWIHFNNSKYRVTDDDVERLRPCVELADLNLLWEACDITDAGLAKLAGFPKPERFNLLALDGAKLTPACLASLARFKSLSVLDLPYAPLGNQGLAAVARLENLKSLKVGGWGVTDEGLTDLRGLTNLEVLSVARNPKVTDAGLKVLRELRGLKVLELSGTGVTATGLETVAATWPKLEGLWLQNMPVRDADLTKIKGLTELRALALSETKITDAGLTHLRGMGKLGELFLPNTAVTDKGLDQLGTLCSLRSVELRGTSVTAAGVKKLATALPQCKIVWDGGVIEPKPDPQRETAEWVLSIGGTIKIRQDGQEKDILAAKDLPAAPFEVVSVSLVHNSKVDVAGLARLKGLANLTHLELSGTQVTDAGLEHLKGLANLTWLRLGYTRVTDAGLVHLKGLTNLTFLNLWGERVSDAGLVHLKGMTKLTGLNLTDTQVSGAGLEHLKTLSSLTDLRVGGTQVSDAGLEHVRTLGDHLIVLDLTGTQVSDAGLVHLKGMSKLSWLFLGGTRVTDSGLVHIKELTNLTRLSLPVQVTNAGLVHLKRLTNLERLHLEGTQVSDAGMEHLEGLTNLTDLALGWTQVSDHGLVHLKGLAKLTTLGLHATAVSDAGTTHLAGLTSLTGLWLNNTRISDAGLKHLYALTSLQELHLTGTKVAADGVAALQKALPKCKIVKEGGVIESSKK